MSELLAGADISGLPQRGKVVVGFSGGADSTALAHWLLGRLGPERLVLAHVNHQLRGEESDRDEAAARAFAQRFGLDFALRREDVAALARRRGLGLEECGRQVRYGFFQSLAPGEEDRILTAHNANDNAETVLMHLCRGTSLPGLLGIPARRGKVLRPLLRVPRGEIEAYCQAHGLPYVTDSSNLSREYTRNRLRLEVVVLMVSFTSSSEMYLWDSFSLPPKYTRLSALPMMPSQSSLNSAFNCDMFCRIMVAMMFLDLMVACKRA